MTAPSKSSFSDFVDKTESVSFGRERELLGDVAKASEVQVRRFFEDVISGRDGRIEVLIKHEVAAWMFSQPGYKKAVQLMFGQPSSSPTSVNQEVEEVVKLFFASGDRNRVRLIHKVSRFDPSRLWPVECILAVDAYLHHDHQKIVTSHKSFVKNVELIKKLIGAIQPFAEHCRSVNRYAYLPLAGHSWDLLLQMAKEHPPRAQKTAPELNFIRRMAKVNKRFKRAFKPPVIAELMTMECFERQFDQRHIYTVCAAMAEVSDKG